MTLAPPEIECLGPDLLPAEFRREFESTHDLDADGQGSLPERVAEFEERVIRRALEANGWNQSKTARALKVPVQTLRYKMTKLGIPLTSA